jgi:hypothetical protein
MNKVASLPVHTKSLTQKNPTFFCFVFRVNLLVLSELVRTMSKLALFLIWAKALLKKLFAELRFLFILPYGRLRLIVTGVVSG